MDYLGTSDQVVGVGSDDGPDLAVWLSILLILILIGLIVYAVYYLYNLQKRNSKPPIIRHIPCLNQRVCPTARVCDPRRCQFAQCPTCVPDVSASPSPTAPQTAPPTAPPTAPTPAAPRQSAPPAIPQYPVSEPLLVPTAPTTMISDSTAASAPRSSDDTTFDDLFRVEVPIYPVFTPSTQQPSMSAPQLPSSYVPVPYEMEQLYAPESLYTTAPIYTPDPVYSVTQTTVTPPATTTTTGVISARTCSYVQ